MDSLETIGRQIRDRMDEISSSWLERRMEDRDIVYRKWSKVFSRKNILQLSSDNIYKFLVMKNNRHWKHIHRHIHSVTENMDVLKTSLQYLLYGEDPISERINNVKNKRSDKYVKGLGMAGLTAILHVAHKGEYPVLNMIVFHALMKLGVIRQKQDLGRTDGERYENFIKIAETLRKYSELDYWMLDWAFYLVTCDWKIPDNWTENWTEDDEEEIEIRHNKKKTLVPIEGGFQEERELHLLLYHLISDGQNSALGCDELSTLSLYEDERGDGYEYSTPVGRIDLLCEDNNGDELVIIELKKGVVDRDVIGQILSYMNWADEYFGAAYKRIRGIIIGRNKTKRLEYGLKKLPDISFIEYSLGICFSAS